MARKRKTVLEALDAGEKVAPLTRAESAVTRSVPLSQPRKAVIGTAPLSVESDVLPVSRSVPLSEKPMGRRRLDERTKYAK